MYKSKEISYHDIQAITSGEDNRPYKIGPGNRIIYAQSCVYCGSDFYPGRSDQIYCSGSCRTSACYERKRYKYQSGRYVKGKSSPANTETDSAISVKKEDVNSFSWNRVAENAVAAGAIGTLKHFTFEKQVMDKLKDIEAKLSAPLVHPENSRLEYINVITQENGAPLSLWRDTSSQAVFLSDAQKNWYQVVSDKPFKIQRISKGY